jgi:serine/threonine protein kinase
MEQNGVLLLSGSPTDARLAGDGKQHVQSATAVLHGQPGMPELLATIEIDDGMLLGTFSSTVEPAVQPDGARTTRSGRTTVLPRRRMPGQVMPSQHQRPRFERVRLLGKGAMGEVELALDHDIRRTVAVKRVLGQSASRDALLRFADEVRVVGQLEHPSIVPIYDVGQDEDGQLYLVMKHLQGDTMEDIIQKLRSADPAARARFTLDYRVHLFFSVLDAMSYAHARGILHRDLKPANIQVGPYGEVTVMDWGIARPFHREARALAVEPLDRTLLESRDQRLVETHIGSLAGTPLYMSPEQAAGRNDELDDRSDVYALSVLLYEWLALEHPMTAKRTVIETLATIIGEDYDSRGLIRRAEREGVPMEYIHVIVKGLARDREQRLSSIAELEEALKRARDGSFPVECPVTFGKHVMYGGMRWIDRSKLTFTVLLLSGSGLLLGGLVYALWRGLGLVL